jgi:hypothetical protein
VEENLKVWVPQEQEERLNNVQIILGAASDRGQRAKATQQLSQPGLLETAPSLRG